MKKIKLFICHSFFDNGDYYKVLNLLHDCPIPIINYSCTKNESIYSSMSREAIEEEIIKRISLCNVFILILGEYFTDSSWMKFEVEQARQRGIPVLSVIPNEYSHIKIQSFSPSMVGLNKNMIPAILSLVMQD